MFNDEKMISLAVLILTSFIFINVNAQVGTAYSIMALIYFITVIARDAGLRPVELIANRQNLLIGLSMAFILFIGFAYFMSFVTTSVFNRESVVGVEGYIRALQSELSIPVLSTDVMIREVIW
jgi:hypothetical protein